MVSFWLPWFTPGSVLEAALGSWSPGCTWGPQACLPPLFPLLGLASSLQPWRRHVENQPAQLALSISAMACLASSVEARSSFSWLTPGVQGSSFGCFILSDSLEDSELLGSGLAAAAAAAAGSSLPFCLA